jgi:hypothetical protein
MTECDCHTYLLCVTFYSVYIKCSIATCLINCMLHYHVFNIKCAILYVVLTWVTVLFLETLTLLSTIVIVSCYGGRT